MEEKLKARDGAGARLLSTENVAGPGTASLQTLAGTLEGELYFDKTMRTLYATDASAYREMPLAVAVPKTIEDIQKLIAFARREKTSLIPRTAGTSLAGQVVGKGIIVDVSKYFTRIVELKRGGTLGEGATGCHPRRIESFPTTSWTVVRTRDVDGQPGHDRRNGRQ
jgi:hypothetical protein